MRILSSYKSLFCVTGNSFNPSTGRGAPPAPDHPAGLLGIAWRGTYFLRPVGRVKPKSGSGIWEKLVQLVPQETDLLAVPQAVYDAPHPAHGIAPAGVLGGDISDCLRFFAALFLQNVAADDGHLPRRFHAYPDAIALKTLEFHHNILVYGEIIALI